MPRSLTEITTEIKPPPPNPPPQCNDEDGLSEQTQNYLTAQGVYPALLPELAGLGYTEVQLVALLNWALAEYPGQQRRAVSLFVGRARQQAKAPDQYTMMAIRIVSPGAAQEAPREPEAPVDHQAAGVWEAVLQELEETIPPALFDTWVAPAQALGIRQGALVIGTYNMVGQAVIDRQLGEQIRVILARADPPLQLRVELRAGD
ncbi:MAG: DnaA N-terminal domain-containing protein [Anaerolineaceae bacterium]|nr:DnaA N-terminal domain-containing protein [Anaerolineaceae bacterium]